VPRISFFRFLVLFSEFLHLLLDPFYILQMVRRAINSLVLIDLRIHFSACLSALVSSHSAYLLCLRLRVLNLNVEKVGSILKNRLFSQFFCFPLLFEPIETAVDRLQI
jgi:hypothetical protein